MWWRNTRCDFTFPDYIFPTRIGGAHEISFNENQWANCEWEFPTVSCKVGIMGQVKDIHLRCESPVTNLVRCRKLPYLDLYFRIIAGSLQPRRLLFHLLISVSALSTTWHHSRSWLYHLVMRVSTHEIESVRLDTRGDRWNGCHWFRLLLLTKSGEIANHTRVRRRRLLGPVTELQSLLAQLKEEASSLEYRRTMKKSPHWSRI